MKRTFFRWRQHIDKYRSKIEMLFQKETFFADDQHQRSNIKNRWMDVKEHLNDAATSMHKALKTIIQ